MLARPDQPTTRRVALQADGETRSVDAAYLTPELETSMHDCTCPAMEPHLSDSFLERVKGCYRLAIESLPVSGGQWTAIDHRRADVHSALVANDNHRLREIFRNPTTTDLYYGVDHLCRSIAPIQPDNFLDAALQSDRGRSAVYQADLARVLLGRTNSRSILEIGPGMGRVCYHLYLSGSTDCTTIDLPLGIVAQACFLGRALGPDTLWFAGEEENLAEGRIKLLFTRPNEQYGLAVNVDSITEMPETEAFRYAQWLSSHASLFLSINHGRNRFTVAELMAFAGMKCRLRKPWSMAGYVDVDYFEEVYSAEGRAARFGTSRRYAFQAFVVARRLIHRTFAP